MRRELGHSGKTNISSKNKTRQVRLPLLSLQNITTGWTSYVQTKEFELSHVVSEYSSFKVQPRKKCDRHLVDTEFMGRLGQYQLLRFYLFRFCSIVAFIDRWTLMYVRPK